MKVSYKPLWKLLIDKGMKKKELCKSAGISAASVTKMGKGGHVSTKTLSKICSALKCKIEDIVEVIPKHPNTVYFHIESDGKWSAKVACIPNDKGDIPVVREGTYPVMMYYNRYDIMGGDITEAAYCQNREELLSALNWCGSCRNVILQLWGYHKTTISKELAELYNICARRRYEIAQEDITNLMEE